MDAKLYAAYRAERASRPFIRAVDALSMARAEDKSTLWQETRVSGKFERLSNIGGFEIRLVVETESIFPVPDKHGNTDYGRYVQEVVRSYSDWGGNWPEPAESAAFALNASTPSGPRRRIFSLSYQSIRYGGPGWVQGEQGGYFIPEDIAETFADFRKRGQSWAVAWDLTRESVEEQISALFSAPLLNLHVTVEAWAEGVKLGSSSMGTDIIDNDEGRAYIFEMVDEHGMIDEAVREARERLDALRSIEA